MRERKNQTIFAGPILFLMVFYLDRVEYEGRKMERTIPLISVWGEEDVKDRIKEELGGSGFGHGRILDRVALDQAIPSTSNATRAAVPTANKSQFDSSSDVRKSKEGFLQHIKETSWMARKYTCETFQLFGEYERTFNSQNDEEIQKAFKEETNIFTEAASQSAKVFNGEVGWDDISGFTEAFYAEVDLLCATKVAENAAAEKAASERDAVEKAAFYSEVDFLYAAKVAEKAATEKAASEKAAVDKATTSKNIGKGKAPMFPESAFDAFHLQCLTQTDEEVDDVIERAVESAMEFEEPVMQDPVINMPRTRRAARSTLPLKSPYFNRLCPIEKKITIAEQNLCNYVFIEDDKQPDSHELMFSSPKAEWDIFLFRDNMCTLRSEGHVSSFVIRFWSLYLNDLEEKKAPDTPGRFFADVYSTMYLGGEHQLKGDELVKAEEKFCSKMDSSLARFKGHISISNCELIFFPMYLGVGSAVSKHYILYVFDLKANTFVILDNLRCNTKKSACVYDDISRNLRRAVKKWLQQMGDPRWKDVIKMKTAPVLCMSCQTLVNFNDCGIYLMRHMESYFGKTDWDCGIRASKTDEIELLRRRYCNVILRCKRNRVLAELESKIHAYDTSGTFEMRLPFTEKSDDDEGDIVVEQVGPR